jgi:hypothetical protein
MKAGLSGTKFQNDEDFINNLWNIIKNLVPIYILITNEKIIIFINKKSKY